MHVITVRDQLIALWQGLLTRVRPILRRLLFTTDVPLSTGYVRQAGRHTHTHTEKKRKHYPLLTRG